jgi:CheY-like chemotaxis protein
MARELDGVHVMVVEDNDDSRDMLRVALEYCGALVTTAGSVEEALSMLGTLRPHVLVTDISMPHGRAAVGARRARGRARKGH